MEKCQQQRNSASSFNEIFSRFINVWGISSIPPRAFHLVIMTMTKCVWGMKILFTHTSFSRSIYLIDVWEIARGRRRGKQWKRICQVTIIISRTWGKFQSRKNETKEHEVPSRTRRYEVEVSIKVLLLLRWGISGESKKHLPLSVVRHRVLSINGKNFIKKVLFKLRRS